MKTWKHEKMKKWKNALRPLLEKSILAPLIRRTIIIVYRSHGVEFKWGEFIGTVKICPGIENNIKRQSERSELMRSRGWAGGGGGKHTQ